MKRLTFLAGIFFLGLLPHTLSAQADTLSFFVNGLCGMCKDRIEKAAHRVDGVVGADWEIASHTLTVTTAAPNFSEEELHQAIANAGHDTETHRAPDEAYGQLHGCCKYRDPYQVAAHADGGATYEFFVDGVCGMCQERIERAVLALPEVKAAEWDIDSRQLTVFVSDDDFEEDRLHRAVNAVGHDTERSKAPDAAYDELHACCKYRDAEVIANHRPVPERPTEVSGRVMVEEDGQAEPLPGVNIYWLNEQMVAVTDEEGRFTLRRPADANMLVASYVGYYTDTIALTSEYTVELTLTPGTTLEAVEVTYERKSIEVSFLDPRLVQQINSEELLKAACCTLAESFETNPAVDVAYTDAVTGARQIEMLGLAGPYTQITRENLPDIRGLAAIYGLVYLPGPWVESIQLAKGPGSVVNGFESITGQINVELKKPQEGERFYFNLYGNEGQRWEANANARFDLSDNWHTGLLLHGNWQSARNDRNDDGFLDMPTGTAWTAVNRWKYQNQDGWNGQFGVKATNFDKTSGQLSYAQDPAEPTAWGVRMRTQRLEGWAKVGKAFLSRPGSSVGLQLSGTLHDQDASFGSTRYDADQQSFYANFIYREELGDPAHALNAGLSYQWDRYEEQLNDGAFDRNERVPGAFVEYTYQPNESFTAVAGLRADHHSQFGFFLTPRLHLRYAPTDKTVMRLAAGQGRRTASILAENIGMLASSRAIVIDNDDTDVPYGLNQEVAWNIGANLRQTFILHSRELILTLDAYHTRFDQQVVVDYDHSPREVRFYSLDGRSYSNTFQAQVDYALLRDFDLRLAYRFNDVRTDFQQGTLERPFVSRHRAFANLAYATENGWDFDLTVNWQGAKRIPSTAANPEAFQRPDRSPDFVVTNVQVSKRWWDQFDVYIGVENLFNTVQEDPIIGANDPFGAYFDSSLIWGPIFGRTAYVGMRYTVE